MEIIIPSILSVLLAFLTSYWFVKKTNKEASILRFKEEKYGNLLVYLQGFYGKTANGEMKKKFFEEYYKCYIYASDEVIKAVGELISSLNEGPEKNIKKTDSDKNYLGNIVLSMRKDLIDKTSLSEKDFFFVNIVDEN